MRVHELAKELSLNSKELIEKLKDLNIEVKSHMSKLDELSVALIKEELAPEISPKKKREAKKAEPDKKEIIIQPQDTNAQEQLEKHEAAVIAEEPAAKSMEDIPPEKRMQIEFPVTTKELSLKLKVKPNELIAKLMSLGIFASINQNLDKDTVEIVLHEYGLFLEEVPIGETIIEQLQRKYKELDDPNHLVPRAPVVTFMGHVDHGKTMLLDTIRKTKIVEKEHGGITQHIGASEIRFQDKKIVFLDTPGHEAFTAMRARGANITDIAVLVVAADEGIMPQTLEAIDHAKAAGVPIVVAINKIDKPNANPEKVKRQLAQHEIKLEGWGGDVISCEVSAMTGDGIDHFLGMLLLQAEILELKANPNRKAWGTVIESKLTSDMGSLATVLVQNGTLKIGDPILCGMHSGKVKALINDKGHRLTEAGPSTPIEILGLSGSPDAGSDFFVTESERESKEISSKWQSKSKLRILESIKPISLEDLYEQITGGLKELKIIVKGDTQGSVEALCLALEKLSTSKVKISIIHSAVGNISESDVTLAMASLAVIVGFHIKAPPKIQDICRKEKVDLRLYNIIYQAVEELRAAMEGLLEPKIQEAIQGRAKIRQVFHISKVGMIAGCIVTEGKIVRNSKARLIRNDETVHEDQIVALKRLKDEVKEVLKGYECGLRLGNIDTYQAGDIIETYTLQKIEQKL